ncbi:MAG: tetratricopeptide repeat protein [Elusimicrobia bacterium]|nr:tetratricopeptide repeat protein [Elusimicrobiota bacterium]
MRDTTIAFLALCLLAGGAPRAALGGETPPKAAVTPAAETPDKRSEAGFNEDAAEKYDKAKKSLKDFKMSAEVYREKMASGNYQEKKPSAKDPGSASRKEEARRDVDQGWELIALKGDLPGGLQLFRDAEKLDPWGIHVVMSLSIALDLNGDAKGALAKLTEAIKQDPKNRINYLSDRVALYTKLGRYDEALADSEECLAANKTTPSYWRNHARLLAKMKRFAEASSTYQQGADLDKKSKPFSGDRDFCLELKSHDVTSEACREILARTERKPG